MWQSGKGLDLPKPVTMACISRFELWRIVVSCEATFNIGTFAPDANPRYSGGEQNIGAMLAMAFLLVETSILEPH